jgi:hypothetical protein
VDASSTRKPPKFGTTCAGISSVSCAVGFASPYAATVSGDTRMRTGITSSNASVSRPICTRMRMRASPTACATASKRTSFVAPGFSSTFDLPFTLSTAGSSDSIDTVALPARFN